MPEAGRAIIRDQVAIGGAALPWADRAAFAELMLGWKLRSWHEAHDRAWPVICVRRVPDVAGYLRLCGLPVPAHVSQAADLFRYQPRGFITPLARDIRGRCGKKTGFRGSAGDLSGDGRGLFRPWLRAGDASPRLCRSEEHTSELQSLMRISYAVFCLKQKDRHNLHTKLTTMNSYPQTTDCTIA